MTGLEDAGFFGSPQDEVNGVSVLEWLTALLDRTDAWHDVVADTLE